VCAVFIYFCESKSLQMSVAHKVLYLLLGLPSDLFHLRYKLVHVCPCILGFSYPVFTIAGKKIGKVKK
jgi:hypothetical protein